MKVIVTLLSIFLFSTFVFSQDIKWKTLEEAQKIQKENPEKQIFIDVYAVWCGNCKVMDKKTFSKKSIANYINENFIPVKFDAESKQDIEFYGKTYKKGNDERTHELAYLLTRNELYYPSMVFINQFGLIDKILIGYHKEKELQEEFDKL